jgi:hypothetical protein
MLVAMIKDKTKFVYSKHAKDEWIRDEHGFIRKTPKTFFSAGCKGSKKQPDGNYVVTYRYCDRTDLVLIVSEDGRVITNYRDLNLKNRDNHKGTFYITPKKTTSKLKGKRFF